MGSRGVRGTYYFILGVASGAIETPGICIATKSRYSCAGFPVHSSVGEGDLSLVSLHLHLVVAALGLQALPAQHLPPVHKPLGVKHS